MLALWLKRLLLLALLPVCLGEREGAGGAYTATEAEDKAITFLLHEVPAWPQKNGCFSCHNNGDGARALYAAAERGYRVPAAALSETTLWVSHPERWDKNKGDPGFSDQRLADIQFAASLLAAFESGQVKDRRPLFAAARRLMAGQSEDGAWHIEEGNRPGSPATYGTPLATALALRSLKAAASAETRIAIRRAEEWLGKITPDNVLAAAALLGAFPLASNAASGGKAERSLDLLLAAQARDGGWGPYADAPAEPFDTAVVLLALSASREKKGVREAIDRGRAFLSALQNPDGSWPETTRPPGGESYAQRLSTTGWATLALLSTP